MTRTFSIQRGTTRVIFGTGSAERIADHLAPLSVRRVLVVSTPGRADRATRMAASLNGSTYLRAREHVPLETVEEACRELGDADAVLALGGGSAIGLAKALALNADLRVIAVPTTYSGSEMTPVYGITQGREK